MSVIIIPRKHLRQPQGRVHLRADNAYGANRVYLLNGANPGNLITRAGIVPPAVASYKMGPASRFAGAEYFYADDQPAHTGAWTALAVVEPQTSSGVRNIFSYGLGGSYSLQVRQNASGWECYQAASTDLGVFANDAVTLQPQVVAAQWDGVSTLQLYINGALKDTRSDVLSGAFRTTSEFVVGRESSGVQYFIGGIGLLSFYPRRLPAKLIAELSRSPYQGIRADPIRIYSLPSGPISWSSLTASNITQTGARLTLGGITR